MDQREPPGVEANDGTQAEAARRPGLLSIVLTVALCGAFVGLLGPPLMAAYDQERPHRQAVRAAATPSVTLPLEVEEGVDASEIRDALQSLPAGWVRLAQREGLSFRVVSGQSLGKADTGQLWPADVMGHYQHDKRRITVAAGGDQPGKTALHEFGHFLDQTLGLTARDFDLRRRCHDRYLMDERLAESDVEYFAEAFALRYFSDRSRARQESACPEVGEYLATLEARAR